MCRAKRSPARCSAVMTCLSFIPRRYGPCVAAPTGIGPEKDVSLVPGEGDFHTCRRYRHDRQPDANERNHNQRESTMKRRTLDVLFSIGGVGIAALLFIAGFVLQSNANFATNYVHDQLAQQQ